jgi:hypothetical protein
MDQLEKKEPVKEVLKEKKKSKYTKEQIFELKKKNGRKVTLKK